MIHYYIFIFFKWSDPENTLSLNAKYFKRFICKRTRESLSNIYRGMI